MPIDHDTCIRELLRRRGALLAGIYIHTRDMHEAEDIYQDLLLKLMKSGEAFESADSVYRWARVAGRHAAIDVIRRRGRRAAVIGSDVLDLLEGELDAASHVDHADELAALRHCLDALNPDARRMIQMRYEQELSGVELARRLGRPPKSVYVSISRVYRKLADCIADRVGSDRRPRPATEAPGA